MPAYHSSAQCAGVDRVGNVALLPIKCSVRGPVASLPRDSKDPDIIDEAIQYFKVCLHYLAFGICHSLAFIPGNSLRFN